MTRKRAKQYEQLDAAILKLDNVPGPEAPTSELTAHYARVRNIFAIHRYNDVIAACHWCCDMEAGLAFSKPDEARGSRMFCSGRCASAHAACRVIVHGHPKPQTTDAEITPPAAKAATSAPKPPKRDDKANENPPEETADKATKPADAAAASESPSAWKPKGQRTRKPRKERAKKPERNNGKCAKGIHQMDEANRYEYKGTIWCRECRKASRAKSKNGNGKNK